MQKQSEEFQGKLLSEYRLVLTTRVFRPPGSRIFAGSPTIVAGLLTVGAGTFVSWRIVRRMGVLRSNTEALSNLRELSQPLTGDDEIAAVDKTFHSMARKWWLALRESA